MSNNRENVTIKEIARRAGVSVSTVSRVMSGKKTAIPISEKTRQKVMKVCNELKFLPDVNYTKLQERRSYTIAFLVPRAREDSPHPVFVDENIGAVLSELEMRFAEKGYSILVQTVDPHYEQERQHLRILRNNTVDGLLIWDAFRNTEVVAELVHEHRPAICIAFDYDTKANTIVPDNHQGAFDMTRYLQKLGHRRIAYINGGMGERTDHLREAGYRQAMSEAGLEPLISVGNYKLESGRRCTLELLDRAKDLTAVFAAGDLMAIGALHAARERGLSVPGNLAVAGFDGSSASELMNLTTCALPMKQIGREAADTMISMIEDLPEGPYDTVFEKRLRVEVIERDTTRPRR